MRPRVSVSLSTRPWPLVEADLRWKTIFGGRQPLVEDYLRLKTTIGGRLPSIEDDLWWKMTFSGRQTSVKTTFGGRQPSARDNLWQKTTCGGRQPYVEDDLRWILACCLHHFVAFFVKELYKWKHPELSREPQIWRLLKTKRGLQLYRQNQEEEDNTTSKMKVGLKMKTTLKLWKLQKINAEESKREDCQNEDDLKNKSKMIIIIKKKYKCGTMSLCGRGGGGAK